MCIIIALPELEKINTEITKEILKFSWESNKDGGGYSFIGLDKDKNPIVIIKKGFFSFNKFYKKFKTDREVYKTSKFLIHFRYSTYGDSKTSNCHPFYINRNNAAIAHNGTFFNFDLKKETGPSDSKVFADFLKTLPNEWYYNSSYNQLIANFIKVNNKIVVITKENNLLIWNKSLGFLEGDIWFSSNYFKNKRKEYIPPENNVYSAKNCCMCHKNPGTMFITLEGRYRCFCGQCHKKIDSDEYYGKCISCKKDLSFTDIKKYFCEDCNKLANTLAHENYSY